MTDLDMGFRHQLCLKFLEIIVNIHYNITYYIMIIYY